MKLHRLSVTNYRGISHREIRFPERGIVVVSGANEVGKTSMVEALDLLIESKDRSTKRDVKQVKPTHADVGAEVEAEISCGPYHFVYRKRFHKRAETHLTIVEPRREQLSGDEAHQRVLDMLGQSTDMNLWKAQRVLQSAGAGTVDLSSSDALTRALDMAAGQTVALSGSEPDLVERIDAEYALYFTATGRPTSEWARATARLAAAEDALAQATAAVAEVDQQVCAHDELTRTLASVIEERAAVGRRLVPLEQTAQAVSALLQQSESATVVADAARDHAGLAGARHDERAQLVAEVNARRAAIAQLAVQLSVSVEEQARAEQAMETAAAAAQQAAATLTGARGELDAARDALEWSRTREEMATLAGRISRIDLATRQLGGVRDELSRATADTDALAAAEAAAHAVAVAEGSLAATSVQIEVHALAGVDIMVNGEQLAVQAGHDWCGAATDTIEITVPGVAVTRVTPGGSAAASRQQLDVARQELAGRLATLGAVDIDQARVCHRRRGELVGERDRLAALLDGLLGGDSVELLRDNLTRLRALAPDDPGLSAAPSSEEARAAVTLLSAQVEHAQEAETAHRHSLTVAAQRLSERSTEATVLRGKHAERTEEMAAAQRRLARVRAEVSDDLLAERHGEAARQAELTARRVADLAGQLAVLQPDRVIAELAEASDLARALDARHESLREQLRDIAVRLEVFGRQGRKDRLDVAASEREHAATEYARIGAKARAVDTLRSVMLRHRDDMRLRYVDPFRIELERLGRMVFGPTFEIEVDSDLTIRSRTLDGRTVPYESLSGGAKEQLGIVARLAGAVLVAPQDAVPVIIDDALGFTDSERLDKMGDVFGAVGTRAQVIVLTCNPDRYRSIAEAERISLSA